jgi:hypothetical protein
VVDFVQPLMQEKYGVDAIVWRPDSTQIQALLEELADRS